MRYEVIVVPTARAELREILAYISDRSPSGAARWLESFERALGFLEQSPLACGLAPESKLLDRDVRQFLFKTRRGLTYRALFEVTEDTVRVLRVRGPGQDLIKPDDW